MKRARKHGRLIWETSPQPRSIHRFWQYEVARYDKDGGRIATTIFEAAAWHYAVKAVCGRCGHSATFHPHALWWHFSKRGWSDNLRAARSRFWCRNCAGEIGARVTPMVLELVRECERDICLTMPPANEWKRAVNRFRS